MSASILPRAALFVISVTVLACASGGVEDEGITFGTYTTTTATTLPTTMGMTTDDETTGDTDATTDPSTGDGDGDAGPVCGNGAKEAGEFCDGADLGGATCMSLGYSGGSLACQTDCAAYDISGCTVDTCGNGVLDDGELCDGPELMGQTCVGIGFGGGQLGCSANCLSYDTSMCTDPVDPVCGNGVAEGNEVCDGADLKGQTCISQGFDGGNLACNPSCTGFNTGNCVQGGICGDNIVDPGEDCDGNNLNGQNCVTGGFAGGTLLCTNCMYDASLCHDGDCCTANFYAGCEVLFVENCVCAQDAWCCNNEWDNLCVDQAIADCMAQCP